MLHMSKQVKNKNFEFHKLDYFVIIGYFHSSRFDKFLIFWYNNVNKKRRSSENDAFN